MHTKVPDFSQVKVLVFGDVMLDRYWHGNTQRISPEAPVPIVHVKKRQECPGGAGNVALNMAALGVQVGLFGICGDDADADILLECLEAQHLEHHLLRENAIPTITKLRVVSVHQQLLRLDFEETLALIDKTPLYQACIQQFSTAQVLILSDYGKGTLNDPQLLIQQAKLAQLPVLIDPKRTDFSAYRGATLITPNFKEFQAVVGVCTDEASIYEKGMALIQAEDLEGLLITRGEQGMTLLQKGHSPVNLPAKAREVYDVTGAGDTVVAVLAASLAAGESMVAATKLANIAAGLVVAKLGAANVTVTELQQEIRHELASRLPEESRGLVPISVFVDLLLRAMTFGETVVIASGHFDLVTNQHLAYLEAASELGDRLMIMLKENDSSPAATLLNNTEQRLTVVAGLKVVDWVVLSDEFLIKSLIHLPHFPIDEFIPGERCDIDYQGGKLIILPSFEVAAVHYPKSTVLCTGQNKK